MPFTCLTPPCCNVAANRSVAARTAKSVHLPKLSPSNSSLNNFWEAKRTKSRSTSSIIWAVNVKPFQWQELFDSLFALGPNASIWPDYIKSCRVETVYSIWRLPINEYYYKDTNLWVFPIIILLSSAVRVCCRRTAFTSRVVRQGHNHFRFACRRRFFHLELDLFLFAECTDFTVPTAMTNRTFAPVD